MPHQLSIPDAANHLPTVRRICVVGVSGAGKSTLSQALAHRLGLRYVSLDRDVRWLPGWTIRDRSEQRKRHNAFVGEDNWVIDGTTVSMMDTRLPRCQMFIWLRPPRHVALAGVARRVWTGYGKVRPDMADGCPEQLPDLEFLRWIWTFEKRQTPRIKVALERFAPDVPVLTLRSRSDTKDLLSRL